MDLIKAEYRLERSWYVVDRLSPVERNKRVQENDPVMHGETDCLRNAGLMEDYNDTEMYTTLSPCMMCTGAIPALRDQARGYRRKT